MDVKSTLTRALLCLALLSGVSACDSEPPPPTAPTTGNTATPSDATSTSSATPTPTPTDDKGRAVEAVVAYWAAIDAAAADPSVKLGELATVARGQALAQWQTTLADYRAKGWRQTGTSTVTGGRAISEPSKGFTVTVCRDVTSVDVLDMDGKSVVRPDRPGRQSYDYQVTTERGAFFVTEDRLKGKPCVG